MDKPKMNDSGERRTFSTGAVRDRGGFKPRPDLISPHANLREGAWLAKGAEKYGLRNYEKGMPISECVASMNRHLEAFKLGTQDEDHITAIRTNAGFIIHFEEEIKAGRMDPVIDDMPKYAQRIRSAPTNTECEDRADMKVVDSRIDGPRVPYPHEADSEWIPLDDPRSPVQTVDADGKCCKEVVEDGPATGLAKPTFYIAGPMRGIPLFNFPAFDKAAAAVRERGFVAVNPAELDRAVGINPVDDPGSFNRYQTANPDYLRQIVTRDLVAILSLEKTRGDGLVLLPGWGNSTGARAEVALALWLGLRFKMFDSRNVPSLFGIPSTRVQELLFHQPEGENG